MKERKNIPTLTQSLNNEQVWRIILNNLLKRNWGVIETYLKERYGNKYEDYSNESWKMPNEWEEEGKIFLRKKENSDIKYIVIRNMPKTNADKHKEGGLEIGFNKNGKLEVVNNLSKTTSLAVMHKSQVRDRIKSNISDISSYVDCHMYSYEDGKRHAFRTITEIIATYEKHEQEVFNVEVYHRLNATPLEIEKKILKKAIMTVGFIDEDEDGLAHELVKLSSCTYWMDKYEDDELEKIKKFIEREGGKYYFQPDQRCFLVQELIYKDPRIASETMTFEQCQKEHA